MGLKEGVIIFKKVKRKVQGIFNSFLNLFFNGIGKKGLTPRTLGRVWFRVGRNPLFLPRVRGRNYWVKLVGPQWFYQIHWNWAGIYREHKFFRRIWMVILVLRKRAITYFNRFKTCGTRTGFKVRNLFPSGFSNSPGKSLYGALFRHLGKLNPRGQHPFKTFSREFLPPGDNPEGSYPFFFRAVLVFGPTFYSPRGEECLT